MSDKFYELLKLLVVEKKMSMKDAVDTLDKAAKIVLSDKKETTVCKGSEQRGS
jgi:hypothetical protein